MLSFKALSISCIKASKRVDLYAVNYQRLEIENWTNVDQYNLQLYSIKIYPNFIYNRKLCWFIEKNTVNAGL